MSFDLEQEANYVLGMMDLYQSDSEVEKFLKMKGLTHEQVTQVMLYVKKEGYEKRVRQSKRIFLIGLGIAVVTGISWYIMEHSGLEKEDTVVRIYGKTFRNFLFYAFLYGIGQTLFGIYRFITYNIKLKKLASTI